MAADDGKRLGVYTERLGVALHALCAIIFERSEKGTSTEKEGGNRFNASGSGAVHIFKQVIVFSRRLPVRLLGSFSFSL